MAQQPNARSLRVSTPIESAEIGNPMRNVLIDTVVTGPHRSSLWIPQFAFILLLVIAFFAPFAHAQTIYEADASANAIEGTAVVESCAGCLDGKRVGNIGNGNANYLRIKGISVPTTGTYTVALYYTEGTDGGTRSFTIQINNGVGPTLSNLTGSSWTAPAGPVIFEASFTAGNSNSIGFFNATAATPDVDHITVSATPLEATTAPTTLSPTVYEGDASANVMAGSATVESCSGCLDGMRVGLLGSGSSNFLTIKGITVPTAGVYSVTLYYVEGSDGGTRGFDVHFGDGSDLSLNDLSGGSWSAPATPVTFLASFTAGSNNSLTFSNADGPAPDVDHIVVSSAASDSNSYTPPSSGGASGSGGWSDGSNSSGNGSGGGIGSEVLTSAGLADNLVNDYIPQGSCGYPVLSSYPCEFYVYDSKTKQDSAFYGRWKFSGENHAWDTELPIYAAQKDECSFLVYCYFQPDYFMYSGSMPLESLNVSDISKGVTFLLKVYTQPHKDSQNNPLTGDAVTALGEDKTPVFSIRTIGNRWALHSYQGLPGDQTPTTGFDVGSWEPYNYPGNVNLYEDVYYTFTSDGRLTIDKFTPYSIPPVPAWIKTYYNWEEAVFDDGWPSTWNSDGSRTFAQIASLELGGVDSNQSAVDGFRELQVFNTALNNQQMITLENSFHNAGVWLNTGMVPCNSGQWMDPGLIATPCDGILSSSQGGNQNPVQYPQFPVTGFNEGTDSFAPSSFTADDTNFNFTFSYSPPPQGPPLSEIQDPSQPPVWAPFYPVTPLDYTLYIQTQDASGIHQCQADLSQVGAGANPGGGVLGAVLGADYSLQSLNGPDTIATTAWINPNPQNFTGVITVPAGWQCTDGSLQSGGGIISGNNSGSTGTGSGSGSGSGNPPSGSSGGASTPNIDLSVWELQLPVGTTGNPTTIPNTQLVTGFEDADFFVSDGALVMIDPGTNCVTTPNSSHCRTELREVNPDGSGASWLANGTNLLDAKLAVAAAGGQVVIGQIHLGDSVSTKPLAELYYDDSGNITVGVEQTTAGGNQVITPLGNVPLGTMFTYEISYSNNQLSISINGGMLVPLSIYSLGGLPVYFKAGSYGQTTARSEVHFFALKITHPASSPASGGGSGSATGGGSASINSSAWYNVVNVNSGRCLDVYNWGTALGTSLDQWACGNGQANQQWQFTPVGNGTYQVSSRWVAMSWNVTGGTGTTSNKVPIQLWSYAGNTNEQWQAVLLSTDSNGNGIYKFIAQNSGLCLDTPGASLSDGQQLDQYSCNGTNAQAFTLVTVTPAASTPIAPTPATPPPSPTPNSSAWYNVVNVESSLCLDVYNWGTDLGTSLDQWSCGNDQANQQWQFTQVGAGIYQVNSRWVAMSWNVTGGAGATSNKAPIQLWSYAGNTNEQWQAVYLSTDSKGNNIYKFIAQNSGLCLDTPGASLSDGQQLDQYSCNGTNAQAFTLVAVTSAASTPIAPAPAAPPPPPIPDPDAWYNVVNVNDGSCLDVYNYGTALGTNLDQWTCGNGQANQQWQFVPVGDGNYEVTSRFVEMSWNVTGGTSAIENGAPIQLWSYGGNNNEKWKPVYLSTDSNGHNVFKFIAQNDGECLDVPGASSVNGLQLDQYSCNGTNAQAFVLTPVTPASGSPAAPTAAAPTPPPTPVASAWYNVVNVNSGACLDVYDWSITLGTSLDQWTCGNGQANQQWQFRPTATSGIYQVTSRYVNMSWNVTGGDGNWNTGDPIQLWSYGGDSNEQWRAVYLYTDGNGNNVYRFVAQNDGLCLDVPSASKANGLQLDQYGCNGTNAQAFTLVRVTPAAGNPVNPVAPAPPPPPLPDGNAWYNVINVSDGSCVEDYAWGTALGTSLDQWTCGNSQANQQWQFRPTGTTGIYQVTNRHVNMSWNVTGGVGNWNFGDTIQLWSYGGNSNEQWRAVYLYTDGNGHNVYRFVAQNDGLCLDVPFSSSANGLQLDQYGCNNTNAQAFTLVQVDPAGGNPVAPTSGSTGQSSPPPPPPPPPNSSNGPNYTPLLYPIGKVYAIQNVNSGLCVDIYGAVPYGALVQWPCGHDIAQQWWFDSIDAQISAFIVSDASVNANAWDVEGGPTVTWDTANVSVWDYQGVTSEQWRAVLQPNGSFNFVAVNSGKCLDVPGSSTQVGQQLDQYDCNGTNAQAFWVYSAP